MKYNNNNIHYISAFTGSGKTYQTSNLLSKSTKPFIYAVPTLVQVEEVANSYKEACNRNGVEPNPLLVIGDVVEQVTIIGGTEVNIAIPSQGRINDLIHALNNGVSVICTHNCFIGVEDKDLSGIEDFRVVLDEVNNLIKPVGISKADYQILVDANRIEVEDNGKVNWIGSETDEELESLMMNKVFPRITRLIKDGRVFKAEQFFVEEVPHRIFKEAQDVLVLAYMFEATYMYHHFKALGFNFIDLTEDFYKVARYSEQELKAMAKERLVVKVSRKEPMNVSFGGWSKATKKTLDKLTAAINAFRVNGTFAYEDCIFTCPKDVVEEGKIKFGKATWVYSGSRGTEAYVEKTGVLYLLDKNTNPAINSRINQIEPTTFNRKMNNAFAIQEMVQFIWRSNIRVLGSDKKVTVYFASHRMAKLFNEWLNN